MVSGLIPDASVVSCLSQCQPCHCVVLSVGFVCGILSICLPVCYLFALCSTILLLVTASGLRFRKFCSCFCCHGKCSCIVVSTSKWRVREATPVTRLEASLFLLQPGSCRYFWWSLQDSYPSATPLGFEITFPHPVALSICLLLYLNLLC